MALDARIFFATSLLAAACGPRPMMAGVVTSTGGELGDFVFAPDNCKAHPEIDALDLRDSKNSDVTLRVVHPGSAMPTVLLARLGTPQGPRELALTASPTCTMHQGYHALVYGDSGIGVRLECVTPQGGRISGTAGAGLCE